jgi:hypothetical protein
LSEKPKIDAKTAKIMQERTKERSLILKEIRSNGPLTLDELYKAISIDKEKLFKHIIAMRQFGKIAIAGERDDQLTYGLPEGE